jgi:hypothetical protein
MYLDIMLKRRLHSKFLTFLLVSSFIIITIILWYHHTSKKPLPILFYEPSAEFDPKRHLVSQSDLNQKRDKVKEVIALFLFTNSGTCPFDIVHSAFWGSKYPVCTPDTQVLFLSRARMLHTQHSAVQAH